MRDIAVNLTENGWELLVDGYLSPRFARLMAVLRAARAWLFRFLVVFVVGPACALAVLAAVSFLSGDAKVQLRESDDANQIRLTIDYAAMHGTAAGCAPGLDAGVSSREAVCNGNLGRSAPWISVRYQIIMAYLVGALFAVEHLLRKRIRW